MTRDPLDRHASPDRLRALGEAAGLSDVIVARALALSRATPDRAAWLTFLRRSFLITGAVLLLSAVVFFFAFNWAELTRFEKLGLIAAGIVAAVVGAWQWRGALPGEVSLVSAAALVGPLLAVYGQTYQTGADPYELFTGWMLLIVPWVLAARASGAWVLWMVLANVALPLYWTQVVVTQWWDDQPWGLLLAHFAVNAVFWIGWEGARASGVRFASARWPARVLALACLVALTTPTLALISLDRSAGTAAVIAASALPFVLVAMAWRYGARDATRDLFMVAAAMVAVAFVATTAVGKVLDLDDFEAPVFLLLGMMVVGEVTAMVAVLRNLSRREA